MITIMMSCCRNLMHPMDVNAFTEVNLILPHSHCPFHILISVIVHILIPDSNSYLHISTHISMNILPFAANKDGNSRMCDFKYAIFESGADS